MSEEPPFWGFSLRTYARPGVPEACLLLQDRLGADVNLILFAAWLGTRGVALDAARLAEARAGIGAWHAEVVVPLRGVRRRLKPHGAPAAPLREGVKAAELEAERLEQMALQELGLGWTAEAAAGSALALSNIHAALPATLPDDVARAAQAIAAAAAHG